MAPLILTQRAGIPALAPSRSDKSLEHSCPAKTAEPATNTFAPAAAGFSDIARLDTSIADVYIRHVIRSCHAVHFGMTLSMNRCRNRVHSHQKHEIDFIKNILETVQRCVWIGAHTDSGSSAPNDLNRTM